MAHIDLSWSIAAAAAAELNTTVLDAIIRPGESDSVATQENRRKIFVLGFLGVIAIVLDHNLA